MATPFTRYLLQEVQPSHSHSSCTQLSSLGQYFDLATLVLLPVGLTQDDPLDKPGVFDPDA